MGTKFGQLAGEFQASAILKWGVLRRYAASPVALTAHVHTHRVFPNLSPPERPQEKILWRKLFDHNPLFVTFNDKLAAKAWVKSRLPDLAIPETLWVGASPKELPDKMIRKGVAIKANHGCNYNMLLDGDVPSRDEIEDRFSCWLGETFGRLSAQWAYGQIPPKMFVEELVTDTDGNPPKMINAHVMDGKVSYVGIYLGPKTGERYLSFFSPDGQRLGFRLIGNTLPIPDDWRLPATFPEAVAAASELGHGVDYVRCDFLCTNSRFWFSELTTYVSNGWARYDDQELANRCHADWDLRKSWFLSTTHQDWRESYRQAFLRNLNLTLQN